MKTLLLILCLFASNAEGQEKSTFQNPVDWQRMVQPVDRRPIVRPYPDSEGISRATTRELLDAMSPRIFLELYSRYEKDLQRDSTWQRVVTATHWQMVGKLRVGTDFKERWEKVPAYREPTFPGFIEWLRKQR